jgi:hypothetical protein
LARRERGRIPLTLDEAAAQLLPLLGIMRRAAPGSRALRLLIKLPLRGYSLPVPPKQAVENAFLTNVFDHLRD